MTWRATLPSPIALNDGRTIATLSDARQLVLDLPELHTRNPHWQYAAQLLLEASRKASGVGRADQQLRIALRAEGLL